MNQRQQCCELCGGEAALYCDPDGAFLCWACDANVHGANFLVARHVRHVACAACHSFDDARQVAGAGSCRPVHSLCHFCDPESEFLPSSPTATNSSSSSSSSCISSSESVAAPPSKKPAAGSRSGRKLRAHAELEESAERLLARWRRRMGMRSRRWCAAAASRVLVACEEGAVACLPSRVALAGALWFVMKLSGEAAGRGGRKATLMRLEACTGIPARLVIVAESRIARSVGSVRLVEEGWAECS